VECPRTRGSELRWRTVRTLVRRGTSWDGSQRTSAAASGPRDRPGSHRGRGEPGPARWMPLPQLVPPQRVTKFQQGPPRHRNQAAAGNTGRALRPPQPPGRDLLPAIPDPDLQRVPGVPSAGAVDHRRQRAGRPASASVQAKISRASSRPNGPGPGRAWAGVSQHLVVVRPGGLGAENTMRVRHTTTSFRPVPTQITQANSGLAIPCGPRAARAKAAMPLAGNDLGRLPRAMLLLDARWAHPDVRAEVSRWPCRNGVAVARTRRWRPTGRGGRRLARGWW
jgi:hypothetical protein